jgi:hypothetical protein
MPTPKLVSLIVMLTVFASVGATSWTLMNLHANPEMPTQELVRDAVMAYIKNSHPETGQFMKSMVWTGGRATPENRLGAETYIYQTIGWNVTMQYPVVLDPIYTVTAKYTAPVSQITLEQLIVGWQGTWQNGVIIEISYTFNS